MRSWNPGCSGAGSCDANSFRGPMHLSARRDVLYSIHRVDCLSLDFSSHRAGQTYGPVLDQYGRFGDYNIGRGAVDSQFEKLGSSTRFPTVYRRLYAVLLGNGNLVDPTVGHCRLLEGCCRACPNYIWAPVLVSCFSVRKVHGGNIYV